MVDPVLIQATPPASSYRAQPLTVQELDALDEPLRSRVWATVHMLQLWAAQKYEDGHSQGYAAAINEEERDTA